MITTLIFDFGDVFINLDKKGAIQKAFNLFKIQEFDAKTLDTNIEYEKGHISTKKFIDNYLEQFPNLNETRLINTWNSILKDFPEYRLHFLQKLAKEKKYKLILLSNTNALHINYIKENVSFYDAFKNCFDAFYLSHEIHLRKPNADIFEYVLRENKLKASACLFIDDTKENTDIAKQLGFHTWNIDETKADVIALFKTKKELF